MSAPKTNPEPPTLLLERRAFNAERREQARDRDARRYRLPEERATDARLTIPHEKGFAVYPPGHIKEADVVISAANELIDSIGHDGLTAQATKPFMASGFIPKGALGLDSPYMQFALSEDVIDAVTTYLDFVPVLWKVDVWYSMYRKEAPRRSQLWHLDHADTTQVKVLLHLDDITPASGPMTVIDADASDRLSERVGWVFDDGRRVTDEQVIEVVGSDGIVRFEGPTGTVDFVDTSRCFHFGSRVEPSGTPRRLFMAQYLTPYAFKFSDHRDQAPYRGLASGTSSELEALVLGAA